MRVDEMVCSGERPARVIRCGSGEEATATMSALQAGGAPPDDIAVIVRGATFVGRRRSSVLRFLPEVVAFAASLGLGSAVAGPWPALALAATVTLLVAALRVGRRAPADPAVRGRRYDVVARADAVEVVDRTIRGLATT